MKKMMMISSQFNEYLECSADRGVVYNNLSSAMIELSKHVYDALLNNQTNTLSQQNINTLLQAGFIVDAAKNEVEEIRKKKQKFS